VSIEEDYENCDFSSTVVHGGRPKFVGPIDPKGQNSAVELGETCKVPLTDQHSSVEVHHKSK
jgi:hypothetical protein